MRRGSEHGKIACLGGGLGSGQRLSNDPWRLRLRRGIRRGAKIPRDAASDCRAHQQQSGPGVFGATRVRDAEIVLSSFSIKTDLLLRLQGCAAAAPPRSQAETASLLRAVRIIKTLPMLVAC